MLTLTRLSILSSSALVLLAFPVLAHSDTFYKWIDQNGRVHYSSQKPNDHQDVTVLNIKEDSKSAKPCLTKPLNLPHPSLLIKIKLFQPYQVIKVQARELLLYTAPPGVDIVKKPGVILARIALPLTIAILKISAKARAQHKQYGGSGVPQLLFGNHKIRGFNTERFEELYYQ